MSPFARCLSQRSAANHDSKEAQIHKLRGLKDWNGCILLVLEEVAAAERTRVGVTFRRGYVVRHFAPLPFGARLRVKMITSRSDHLDHLDSPDVEPRYFVPASSTERIASASAAAVANRLLGSGASPAR